MNYVVTPGTILKEYLTVRKITQKQAALIMGIDKRTVSRLVNNKIQISEELALKLEEVFDDVKAEFWLNLDKHYQLLKHKKGMIIL